MRTARQFLAVVIGIAGLSAPAWALDIERLTPAEEARLRAALQQLEPLITQKKADGSANLLAWNELLEPLDEETGAFIAEFRRLRGGALGATSHYFGEPNSPPDLVPVGPQQILIDGASQALDPQFLPRDVHDAYQLMMQAMEDELGARLLVESGYRSPAYQLYLFLFYMPKHGYSIRETNRFVALPGHSEHGAPQRQAVDFINQRGINGEDRPEVFEALPEYAWLQRQAASFGFFLSYPRSNADNTAFEPWHWHYEPITR